MALLCRENAMAACLSRVRRNSKRHRFRNDSFLVFLRSLDTSNRNWYNVHVQAVIARTILASLFLEIGTCAPQNQSRLDTGVLVDGNMQITLPATSYQLPATSYQLPATSYQLPANHDLARVFVKYLIGSFLIFLPLILQENAFSWFFRALHTHWAAAGPFHKKTRRFGGKNG